MKIYKFVLLALSTLSAQTGDCAPNFREPPPPPEAAFELIKLSSPLDRPDAEVSGMAWCGDKLILQPQYPKRLAKQTFNKGSYFYAIEKSDIDNYLSGKDSAPLALQAIALRENKLRSKIAIFDGYEGIACDGETMWLTIEAVNVFNQYQSYAVPASFEFDSDQPFIDIQADKLQGLPSQSGLRNKGDEALLIDGDRMISVHEVNGQHIVENAQAQWIDFKSDQLGKLNFPEIVYRITDATALDSDRRFWAINYRYSGDKFSDKAKDRLAKQYGQGASHRRYKSVERLVEFEINGDSIELVKRPPIQLQMESQEGRNWEGIARLDNRGLLIVTDKHPETLFGFVPFAK